MPVRDDLGVRMKTFYEQIPVTEYFIMRGYFHGLLKHQKSR